MVGTPIPQVVDLIVDTGSHDFWMNDETSSFCKDKANDCDQYGSFTSQNSNTYKEGDQNFQYEYSDGETVAGILVTDTIHFNGKEFPNVTFGLSQSSTTSLGVLGLGYSKQEGDSEPPVPTFSDMLLNKKIVKLNAYSLWLNDLKADSGSILYGGVDVEKIDGALTTLPILDREVIPDSDRELLVTLNSISFGSVRSQFLRVLLDSGNSGCNVPPEFLQAFLSSLGGEHSEDGLHVDCDVANSGKTLDFEFGSENHVFQIKVPISQFIWPEPVEEVPVTSSGAKMCGLFIKATHDGGPAALGDTFLRSAYVVFDLTNNEISIGKAKYTSASNVLEIPKKGVTAMGLGPKPDPAKTPFNSKEDSTISQGDGTNQASSVVNTDTSNGGTDETVTPGSNNQVNTGSVDASNAGITDTSNTGSVDTSNTGANTADSRVVAPSDTGNTDTPSAGNINTTPIRNDAALYPGGGHLSATGDSNVFGSGNGDYLNAENPTMFDPGYDDLGLDV